MSGYIIISIFILSLFCCILDFSSIKFKSNIFWIFVLVLIIISSSKNENTSFDTGNYIISFYKAPGFNNFFDLSNFRFEPGYVALERFSKLISTEFHLLFTLVSILTLVPLSYIIKKYSPYPFLSLFIYVACFYFKRDIITIRFALSCIMMFISIIKLSQDNYSKSILFAFIAFLFHYTALSYLLFLPVFRLLYNQKIRSVIIMLFCLFALSIAGITLLTVIEKTYKYLPGILSLAVEKGISHLGNEQEAGFKQIIPYLPILLFIYKRNTSNLYKGLTVTYIFALLCMIEFNQSATFSRLNQMYLTIIVLFYPLLLTRLSKRNMKFLYSYIIIFSIYAFIRMTFFNTGGFINIYW